MTIMDKDDSFLKNKPKKKKKKSTPKKHPVLYKMISFLLIVITIITLGVLIYNEIFTIFYIIPITLVTLFIIFIFAYFLNKNKLKNWVKNIISFFSIIIIIFDLIMIFYGTTALKFISNITDTGYRVETFGVYTLKDKSYKTINDLDGKTLFYLDHDDDKNIRAAVNKIKKKVNVDVDYSENVNKLINELNSGNADAILMESSYEDLIKEEFTDIYQKLNLLYTIDIVDNIKTIKSNVDITKDPFIIYLSGIDTSGNVQSKARSDVNILLAVNPKEKTILMINTPRDYYVKLNKNGKMDKLTHAGIYGVEESVHTLEDLYDTKIDYYVRLNFTSFIKIVNALDGIKVDVPMNFCEQDSHRSFDAGDLICLKKGYQTLNGEQALALARHRKTLAAGDVTRGENQMLVLEAIINKALSPKIITKYNSLISSLDGRISTNMTSSEMYKFAKKQVSAKNDWQFESITATGKNSSGVCFSTGSGKSYVMEPNTDVLDEIKNALNQRYEKETV